MKLITFVAAVLAAVAFANAARKSYTGYKLIQIRGIKGSDNMAYIQNFENTDSEFNIWEFDRDDNLNEATVTVMLSPLAQTKYLPLLTSRSFSISVINNNVQDLVDRELQTTEFYRIPEGTPRNIIGRFATFSEILNFISETVVANPDIVSTYDAAQTTLDGKRALRTVRISSDATDKIGIWINCNVHAREWATHPVCIKLIKDLVDGWKANNAQIRTILNKFEFHILPMLNPDGYEFSRTNERYWRKNRNPNGIALCKGVDVNRNCYADWNGGGSSNLKCADTFMGDSACSERECLAVMQALAKRRGRWAAAFDIHSYGGYWLLPPGKAASTYTPDHNELIRYANISMDAIKAVNGKQYKAGTTADVLYVATGSLTDCAYFTEGIKVVATVEVRPINGTDPNATGTEGFNLPEDQVPACNAETLAGLMAVFDELAKNY